jgi:hypothetical protein
MFFDDAGAHEFARETVEQIARAFDDQIRRCANESRTEARMVLPTHFVFGNFPAKDMQLIIYSDLIKLYTDPVAIGGRGLKQVYLDMANKERPIFIVQWKYGLAESERVARMKIIQQAAMSPPPK